MVDFDDLTDQQRAAADALDRNVTLTAGAGTGKTTTLTARYVRMLARGIEGDAPADDETPLLPEEVVTTTFTERAANELKGSVREALTERVADAAPETYEAWREVADGLEEGYVHTVHGFCARLLREHALSVDAVAPGFETLDERETGALLEETVRTLLETHDDHPAVETLARRYDRSALEAILADLLTERPGGIDWANDWADADVADYLAFVNEELHPVSPDLAAARLGDPTVVESVATLRDVFESAPVSDGGGRGWTRVTDLFAALGEFDLPPEATVEARDRFLAVCDALTKGDGTRYSDGYYTGTAKWWDDEAALERFDAAMLSLVDALDPASAPAFDATIDADERSFPFVQALARLTLLAHEEYVERKRRRNVVDFTDQIEFALAFLQDADESLRADLRAGFAYVMVDEFQDTDPRQWEIVKHLTAENPTDYDARNVFVVGDAKQSIYRFRNADVAAFAGTEHELAAANEGDADEADDQLSTNFRTLEPVLEFCNDVFDAVFPPDEDETPDFEATPQRLDAYRDDPESLASTEYLLVPTDEDYRAQRFEGEFATAAPEHDAELEGQALAARLTRLFAGDERIYDPESDIDDPDTKPVEPDDVAVLLRSRTHLKTYERALEDAGIPYTVASGLGFYETPEVTALVNLLRALADPGDERALYGALRSPLFGFTDDTLAQLKADDDALWDALGDADHDELADAYALLTSWREVVGLAEGPPALDGSWAAFLTRVLDETGFLASVAADERPQQAVANVEKFREELRAFSDEGVTSLPTLVRRLDARRDRSDREGEATVQGGGEGVQILTVHDAKGSEFPVVVVPGMGKRFNLKPAVADRLEFEDVGEGRYVAGLKAPTADDPFEDEPTVARAGLKRRRVAEERAEEKRILYVACTRARDRLLLSGTHDLDGESLADLNDADPDEPNSWRDWLQPLLLDEDTLATLDTETRATAHVDGTGVAFDVVLPQPRADWRAVGEADDAAFELSPTPPRPTLRYQLSPTNLASLFAEHGELVPDERTNTVHYEGDDEDADAPGATRDGTPRLAPTAFGLAVHRLCELRPPRERWDDLIDQTLVEEDVEHDLSAADRARIHEHAERAVAYLDERHDEWEPAVTYDELWVTAEFDRGEVGGLVDHLAVTDDAHHVVDYKTNDIGPEDVETKADYYRTQMAAYAVALGQQDPDRAVTATLYFTTPGEPWTFEWSPEEVAELAETFEARIETELAALE